MRIGTFVSEELKKIKEMYLSVNEEYLNTLTDKVKKVGHAGSMMKKIREEKNARRASRNNEKN